LNAVLLNKQSMDEVKHMCKLLSPFFAKYDVNRDGTIDLMEFGMIWKDVHESLPREAQAQMFKAADTDSSGLLNFEEFVACFMSYALDPSSDLEDKRKADAHVKVNYGIEGGEEDDEEVEEDMPEDLANLPVEQQQRRIMIRAASKMAIGTLLVLVFSDPMVDLLSELGNRLDVSPFYISFILAPLASNASELLAAYSYAKKRTQKSITTSLSQLEGAAVMNNTFCLGIFLGLVYFKGLAWEFSAETIAIVAVQIGVASLTRNRQSQRLLDGLIIFSFYPLALALVWALENIYGLD